MHCPICFIGRWLLPLVGGGFIAVAATSAKTTPGMLLGFALAAFVLIVSAITWRMPDHNL